MKWIATTCSLWFVFISWCQSDWKLEYNKDNFQVFTRMPDNSSQKEYKGVVEVNASVAQCVAVLSNISNYTKFMYEVTYAELLERPSKDEFSLYCVINMPWPYTDRDMVMKYHLYNMGNGIVKAKAYSEFGVKHDEKYGTLGSVFSTWLFEPIGPNKTRVTHQSRSNQEGFPDWLVNMFILGAPKYILPHFKQLVEAGA
jgi:hypothetical protein